MLRSLMIDAFAIIDRVTIDFSQGMTVLSGETGAGKSIIIDALGILCGGRGSSEFIRQGSDKLVVEGLFDFEQVPKALEEQLLQLNIDSQSLLEDGLIIRREINSQGKNLVRLNGQLINVTQLKKIGAYLVDIHGQHEHQLLLDPSKHLNLVDQLGDQSYQVLLEQYRTAFYEFRKILKQWQGSQKNEQEQLQKLSFLEFQLAEIEAAQLDYEEYVALSQASQKLQHAVQISQSIDAINYLLTDGDHNVIGQLSKVEEELKTLRKYQDSYQHLFEQLRSAHLEIADLAHQIASSATAFEVGNQSIDEIEARLNEMDLLKRKYNMEIDEIIDYYQHISEEIYQIRHREDYLNALSEQLIAAYEKAEALALKVSDQRKQLGQTLITLIEKELADLYMPNSRFFVEMTPVAQGNLKLQDQAVTWYALNENGLDNLEFYAITNLGDQKKPVVKVASGGELSRFMLALKTVFSRVGDQQTMVFDEIDSDVSGRVAQAIAEKILQVAKHSQVLCITHLAQVAAISHQQLLIEKHVENQTTKTQVKQLDDDERVEMIAQMTSGKVITDSSRQLARELIEDMAKLRT